jgi:hypothetical protein
LWSLLDGRGPTVQVKSQAAVESCLRLLLRVRET